MTLQDWGSLGEVVGGFAVIISLLYLAMQVRQNTASERSGMVSALSLSFAEFTGQLGNEPRLLSLHVRGLAEAEMTEEERLQWDFTMLTMMRKMENAFAQYRLGIVREEEWAGWSRPVLGILRSPGGSRWWGEWQSFVNEGFREHVDAVIGDSSVSAFPPTHPMMRAIEKARGA